MAENQVNFTLLPKVLNGGIAGMIGIAATFPLDLIKTRIQKQQVGADGSKMYGSIWDAMKKIYKPEGIRGLYRGSAVVVVLITPMVAVRFSANDYFRFHLKDKATNVLSPARQGLSGALTGVVQLLVTVPMELLKIQLQDAGRVATMEAMRTGKATVHHLSAAKLAFDLVRSRGIVGLYKGVIPTMCRDVPFCGMYFPIFAVIDSYGPRKLDGSGDAQFHWSFVCALIAGSFSAVMVTPADVMKTRIQTVSKSAQGDKTYSNVFDAFKDILKNEGPRAFYKGGTCRMLVIAPTYAIVQGLYFLGVAEKLLGIERDIKIVCYYGIVVIFLVCSLQIYTATLLGRTWNLAEQIHPNMNRKNRYPYSALAELTFGKYISYYVRFLVDVTVFGGGIPNLIVAAQNLELLGLRVSAGTFQVSFCYWIIVLGTVLCPILWLGSPKDMKILCSVSVLIVSSVYLLTCGCLIFAAPTNETPTNISSNLKLWELIMIAYGIVVFQFDIHPTILTVQMDMNDKSKLPAAIIGGFSVSLFMFATTSLITALKYGSATQPSLLETLPTSVPLHFAAALVAIQLCLTSAVSNSTLYQHMEDCLNIPREFNHKRCILRTILTLLAIVIAESVPRFDLVMSQIGGTLIGPLVFILPPLFYVKMVYLHRMHTERLERESFTNIVLTKTSTSSLKEDYLFFVKSGMSRVVLFGLGREATSLLPKVLNGGIAGMIGIAATFPIDLIKTRIQKQQVGADGSKMYGSIWDAMKKIYKPEGIRGLYRGSAVVVVLITPRAAVRFSSNDYFRFHLKDKATNVLSPARQGLAGALTGVVQLIVTVPMELLKIQLQDAGRVATMEAMRTGKATVHHLSAAKLAFDLVRSRGIVGLYKGVIPTMCRDVPFCCMYFPIFAVLDSYGPRKLDGSGNAQFHWSFVCALITASFSALMVTPSDVMKTRIQTVSKSAEGDKTYSNVFDAFKDILKNEGPRAFYKGGTCRMLVIAPTYAIIQGIYFLGVAEKLLGIERDIKVV